MLGKIGKKLLSVGMLLSCVALLSFSPAASLHSQAVGPEVALGIDVSKYQGGINWQQVRNAGVRFAMIRVGTTKKGLDEQFVNNINGANAAGIRTGIYIYSYATTPEQAAAEANQVLAWIAPYAVTFPVAIDIEDSCQKGLSAAQLQAIADTFCGIINANGYEPMVYSYKNWFQNRMPNVASAKWVAQYGPVCEYAGDYAMWQSTSRGSFAGIAGRVDVNHLYSDYFSRIIGEGFNSWGGHTFYYHNWRKTYGWINLETGRYHSEANGFIQTGWFQDESGIYYLDPGEGGRAKTGFADIDGARFYFNENGVRCTGLLNLGGPVYYTNPDGVCQKGFVTLEDGVHYFGDDYAMVVGLAPVGDAYYLFGENGVMFTGWSGDVSARYYFGPDGKMVKGWNAIEGRSFYFGEDGRMVLGQAAIGDGIYYLDPADGHQVVGWVQQPDGWHYYDANNGKMLANVTALLDNVNCTFDKNGVLVDPAGWTPGQK
jgi:glucan-binding YG repeat protein